MLSLVLLQVPNCVILSPPIFFISFKYILTIYHTLFLFLIYFIRCFLFIFAFILSTILTIYHNLFYSYLLYFNFIFAFPPPLPLPLINRFSFKPIYRSSVFALNFSNLARYISQFLHTNFSLTIFAYKNLELETLTLT